MKPEDLDAWEPQEPPRDFAARVVEAARGEGRQGAKTPRRVAVGVLLVASMAAGVAAVSHLRGVAASGDVVAEARREVRVGVRAVAVLEPGAHVTWGGDAVEQTSGEVFWRVEPGARFAVRTPEGEVTVKGTCFRVKVVAGAGLAAAVAVGVYEGKVALSHGASSVDLVAGEAAQADERGVHAGTEATAEPPKPDAPAEHALAKLDRARADRMREQLHAFFAEAGAQPPAAPAPSGSTAVLAPAFKTMPLVYDDAGSSNVDPSYIQSVVRDDYFPLAKQCYASALERNPKLGGRVEVSFRILGDPKIGGVIDEVELTKGTTLDDREMQTCMRESMMSVTFDAPPGPAGVTVVYPIVFSNEDDDAATE